MNILVNDEPRTLEPDATVLDLLRTLELETRRVAVLVNGEIVRRDDRGAHPLKENDKVDLVHMVGGG